VNKTGGGAFRPDEQRHMCVGAGGTSVFTPYTLVAVSELLGSEQVLIERLDKGHTVMLDSGIFSMTQRHMRSHPGMTMDEALALAPSDIDGFDELFARYVQIVEKYEDRLWGYVELDQGGIENKKLTRAKLEEMGLRPIPVYHPLNDGWDYFDELARSYDRICVGNIVQASTALRVRLLATIWERHRRYPHLWIHGLGYTATALLHGYPVESVDTSTWFAPVRWGQVAKQITADLESLTHHQGHARYVYGDQDSYDKSVAVAARSAPTTRRCRAPQRDSKCPTPGLALLASRATRTRLPGCSSPPYVLHLR